MGESTTLPVNDCARDPVLLLKDLISIPSVNPDGDPGIPAEHCGEEALGAFLAALLDQAGVEVSTEEVAPGRPNILGRFPSDRPGKPIILFAPHLDTVGVGDMTIDPFTPDQRNGRIYGRGASDTKGPMAAMLAALFSLEEKIAELPYEIHFVALAAEESGQLGSRHFARHHGADYAFGIVGEPTSMTVVHTHKGCAWCAIDVPGRAAHGSTPEQGDSAILRAMRLVHHLDSDFREKLRNAAPSDPLLGHSTLNIGMIRGGTRANIVPSGCRITVDIRSTPGLLASGEDGITFLQRSISKVDAEAIVSPLGGPTMPLCTDPDHPIGMQLASAGNGFAGAPWFCDASHLAAAGLPSVAIGPGSIEQAHTEDEWIALEDLIDGTRRFRHFLENLS